MTKRLLGLLLVVLMSAFVGCQSLEQRAPLVSADMPGDTAQFRRGRQIYIIQCADCHSVEPIADYSLAQWRTIVPKMARKAKLSADEQVDVQTYIRAAHAIMPSQ